LVSAGFSVVLLAGWAAPVVAASVLAASILG
jgi:hypothetical protein